MSDQKPNRISTLTDEEYKKLHKPFKSDPQTRAIIKDCLKNAGNRKEGDKLVVIERTEENGL